MKDNREGRRDGKKEESRGKRRGRGGRGEGKYLVSRGAASCTVLKIKISISFEDKNRINKQKEMRNINKK